MTDEQKIEFMNYLRGIERTLYFEAKYSNDITVRRVHEIALETIMDIQCTFEEIASR